MKWMITGGCGFIGTSIVRYLQERDPGVSIRLVDNFTVGQPEDVSEITSYRQLEAGQVSGAPQGIELIKADVCDASAMEKVAQGCDIIVHLAAHTGVVPSIQQPRHDMTVNVIGAFNVLEAARVNAVSKVILASSGAALGKAQQPVNETRLPQPSSPYGAGKACSEMYASAYFHSYDIKTTVLRFSNVYGPGSKRKSSVVAHFIKQALAAQPLTVNGEGGQLRDYIYIDDLIAALTAAADKSKGGEVFQVATQVETSVLDIARTVQKACFDITGRKVEIVHVPHLKGDEPRVTADISKARELLGFSPAVDVSEGVSRTFRYFLARNDGIQSKKISV